MKCPYCSNEAQWVENKEVYGRNYGKSFMIWLCKPCDAYVGCHKNTEKPLGIMADKDTRKWRKAAHEAFDPVWKSGDMTRNQAYKILSDHYSENIHIGESSANTCKMIIADIQILF